MIKHFMILSSSYSSGTRIALHYVIDEHTSSEMLTAEVKKIKDACGETVSISTHYVETNSDKWDSVPDKDAFFAGVKVVDTLDEFVKLISKDRVLKGIDIAKYELLEELIHLLLGKLASIYCLTSSNVKMSSVTIRIPSKSFIHFFNGIFPHS